jgi:hypothetical protein
MNIPPMIPHGLHGGHQVLAWWVQPAALQAIGLAWQDGQRLVKFIWNLNCLGILLDPIPLLDCLADGMCVCMRELVLLL